MTVYANIIGSEIKGVYDLLPPKWNGHDNFDTKCKDDVEFMRNNGFVKITKLQCQYDSNTHKLSDFPTYRIENNEVIEERELLLIPEPIISENDNSNNVDLNEIRRIRDEKMKEFDWRYHRYMRQSRLGIQTTDNLQNLDAYMQLLADITTQPDLNNIVWPTYQE